MEPEMKNLLLQQKNNGDLIRKFVTNTNKTGKANQTKGFLQGRVQLLEKYWNKFEQTHDVIILQPDDKDAAEYHAKDIYSEIETIYANTIGALNDSIIAFNNIHQQEDPQNPNGAGPPPMPQIQQIKLPPISLPNFNGNFNQWTSFHDLFDSLVVKNTSVSNVNKLHHLKTALSGEAELVLRQFAVEGNNFEPAWALLKRRYSNKRMLVNAQFGNLLSQPRIINATPESIRRILDTSTESITALKAQLTEAQRFDALLVYILTQKLDIKTIESWEQSINSNDEFQTFEAFSTFLENHCRTQELVLSTNTNSSEVNKKEHQHITRSYHTASTPSKCVVCDKGVHSVFRCYRFKRLSYQDRHNLVNANNLCIRCLSAQHKSIDCPHPFRCQKCQEPHNSLLHKHEANTSNGYLNKPENILNAFLSNPAASGKDLNTISSNSTVSQQTSSTEFQNNPFSLQSSIAYSNNQSTSQNIPSIAFDNKPLMNQDRTATVYTHHCINQSPIQTLLATVQVDITSPFGQVFRFRALVDPGSQASLMTRSAANLLQLKMTKCNTIVRGLGGTNAGSSNHIVECKVSSIYDKNQHIFIKAIIMPKLTDVLPSTNVKVSPNWNHLQGLNLADPIFYKPERIDLVIGADVYDELMIPEIRRGPVGSPIAQNTTLGWILIGKIFNTDNQPIPTREIFSYHSESIICDQLRKFWELEEVGDVKKPSKNDELCESHYLQTHIRQNNGRYTVDLPFNTENCKPPLFGNSKRQAYIRLCQIEKRLNSNPDLKSQYQSFMNEYIQLGHMKPVDTPATSSFYLPHHAIVKLCSSSTKLRVVFDASAKDSNGVALNQTLRIGPTIQQDLYSILLRWRKYQFALTADAEKMYRQIQVNVQHRPFQRILWRNANDEIIEYELTTVTYGTACAPYLAVRTIHQLANDETNNFPTACERTLRDMYVDDFLSGGDTINETMSLQADMDHLFRRGGFNLRKWSSNSPKVLDHIPSNNREADTCLDVCRDDIIKTLGVFWHTANDEFQFSVKISTTPTKLTKRTLLSDVARLFDPMGLLAPVVINAKLLFQSLWLKGLEWDDQLPPDVIHDWLTLREKLIYVTEIKIPRWLGTSKSIETTELHGFCDASNKAYAAVVFCRTFSNGLYKVQLLTAKTKVAPIKRVSLPNLELCGATLLAKLLKKVQISMEIDSQIFAWTDSTIVLDWIRSNIHKQTFVANRISQILDHTKPSQWRHVRSSDNPADIASRGICPTQLKSHTLWWHGPPWLSCSTNSWPTLCTNHEETLQTVDVHANLIDSTEGNLQYLFEKFSSLDKLVRVTARCLQFSQLCRRSFKTTNSGNTITADGYRDALKRLIRNIQLTVYNKEYKLLIQSEPLRCSKIVSLHPFVCSDELIRVGGRLRNANISFDQKYPILLPREHLFTKLVIMQTHIKTLHGGLKLTLATLRQNYWVSNARTSIRAIIHKCTICQRHAINGNQQLMSDLPMARVTQSKVFSHTGVDYAGPFDVRLSKHRGRGTYKGFVVVFVCLSTKAIHLELASDLSSQSFIAAFKRFIARRGNCSNIYSDNGTNFVGANRELKSSFDETILQITSTAANALAIKGTTWHFIPASSPHFGGLWEAGVKSFKHHLRRILGNSTLTYEEFYTLLTEIESCLNSRPLCPLSSDPNDIDALTPGHFLVGGPMNAVLQPSLLNINENRLTRWQYLEKLNQDFWNSWSKEYLSELQQRPKKWRHVQPNLQKGDIVLIKDIRLPPTMWPLARITATHPGEDGLVRAVSVKHKGGIIKRAINKLCRLPTESIFQNSS